MLPHQLVENCSTPYPQLGQQPDSATRQSLEEQEALSPQQNSRHVITRLNCVRSPARRLRSPAATAVPGSHMAPEEARAPGGGRSPQRGQAPRGQHDPGPTDSHAASQQRRQTESAPGAGHAPGGCGAGRGRVPGSSEQREGRGRERTGCRAWRARARPRRRAGPRRPA